VNTGPGCYMRSAHHLNVVNILGELFQNSSIKTKESSELQIRVV